MGSAVEHNKSLTKVLKAATLKLADIEIDCAVVEDEDGKPVRVLSRRKFQRAIGQNETSHAREIVYLGTDVQSQPIEIPQFLSAQNLRIFVTDAVLGYCTPLWFKTTSGVLAAGYRAELLPEVCDLYLSAQDAGVLRADQQHIAQHCYQLMRAFAKVGIIALVDEVTGFQEAREKDELQRLIEYYLGQQLTPWLLTFTHDFYREAFRLHGLRYHAGSQKRPAIIGKFTAQAIYTQILPAPVYEELKLRNPWTEGGKRKDLHHQWLTGEGRQTLQAQLQLVLHLMRAATNVRHFWHLMLAGQPRSQLTMAFFDEAFPLIGETEEAP